ncbi:SMP-30/gluconolactonase/LRE family protein [Halorarum salinum]|uniref:Uncharacterized protein n=1 Tax=Halorarum salinum TaxID=2743089 RepID=A0A7D5Q9S3_9EURY|nr:hypothetical protein [Halobaculum salinum]QLG61198.1 hypothetical protein HUG12_05385 [Halobaculum salinum]
MTPLDGRTVGRPFASGAGLGFVGVGRADPGDGAADDPGTHLESPATFGADGIAARGSQVYVAANGRNEVVRVAPSGESVVLADADDGLAFPSDVAFGAGRGDDVDLFVCNFATTDPAAAGVLRTRP